MQWLQDLCLTIYNVWVKWFMFVVHMNGVDGMWLLRKNSLSMYLWIYSDLTRGGCMHLIIVKQLRFSILVIGHFFFHWFQKIIRTFFVEGFTLPLVLLLMYLPAFGYMKWVYTIFHFGVIQNWERCYTIREAIHVVVLIVCWICAILIQCLLLENLFLCYLLFTLYF